MHHSIIKLVYLPAVALNLWLSSDANYGQSHVTFTKSLEGPNDFVDDPDVKFPTPSESRRRTIDGDYLQFDTGMNDGEKLICIPILAPENWNADQILRVHCTLETSQPSNAVDMDLSISIIDGDERAVEFLRGDGDGGAIGYYEGVWDTPYIRSTDPRIVRGVGQHSKFTAVFTISSTAAICNGIIGERSFGAGFHTPLNPDAGLNVVILAGNPSETYRIKSLHITASTVPLVADSRNEFTDIQGVNGWRYGYYDHETDPDSHYNSEDFIEFRNFDVDCNQWFRKTGPDGTWTAMGDYWQIPNGPASSRQPEVNWAVRRWVSDIAGTVTICGSLAKALQIPCLPANFEASGDGTLGKITVDGVIVWERSIGGGSFVGQPIDIQVDVGVGSTVDFIVTPHSTISSDWTDFVATIGFLEAHTPIDIVPAAELRFTTEVDKDYTIEQTRDLLEWMPFEPAGLPVPLPGSGEQERILVPTRDVSDSRLFYRVRSMPKL